MPTKNIGFVVDLIGDAQVRSVDGVIRVLSIGDKINDGDILTTGLGTSIVLEFYNGQRFQVGENTEMLLDESVFASLNSYPDDRVDQLAELQSLIVEGIDLADLEATAAGAAAGGADGLHQASVYARDGNEGIVETRVTPFNNDASDPDNQSILDDVNIFTSEDSTSTATGNPAATPTNNDRPIAMDDAITAVEDTPYNSVIELVANDIDLDGDALSIVAGTFATVQGGSITIAADGSYTYTPALNFNGTDSVDYTVSDGSMTDVGTLNITVNAVNDAPVALDDAITAIEDTPFTSTIDLDFNDTDLDGDALTVVAGTFATAQGGSIAIAADGSYTYTPALNFNGSDSVDYTVTDGSLSDTGTLSINVSAVNNAPDAIDDAGALDGAEDSTTGSLNATMLSNDSDLDGDTLSIIEINGTTLTGAVQSIGVTNGTVNIDGVGNITFSANSNYNGPVSFNYTISDGTLTDTATVNGVISAVNDAPVVVDDAITATEDTPFNSVIDLDANDLDVDGDALTVVAGTFATTQGGSITIATDGSYTYTPAANFNGADSVDYTVTDGSLTDV
ncbi:MAG: retention module-containing protein, partial [Gammaproteobacteria bacterium]